MTTKVVKGSAFTLVGQVLPLGVSLLTTPIVIRLLGTEPYGVLLLVGLIPAYFGFGDFGMGMTSTRFTSLEFAKGDRQGEAAAVRTAAVIGLISSLTVAIPILVFADQICRLMNVPEAFQSEAAFALRLSAIAFVFGILANIFNSPQLSRLRMDLNALVSAGNRIALAMGTVIVLYLGGGIIGAVTVSLITSLTGISLTILISGKLLPELFGVSIRTDFIRPMLKMGVGLLFASLAILLLTNLEKLVLTKLISVEALAHYSVAFTFANTATIFSWGMVQSLIPAFSQLSVDRERFRLLFSRGMRVNLVWLAPSMMLLCVIAEPFLTIWAGPEFGEASTPPFYVLLFGLFFNILGYIPYSVVTASGRTYLLAIIYWSELILYVGLSVILIMQLGLVGAALAWSVRVIIDAVIISWVSARTTAASFDFIRSYFWLGISLAVLVPPMVATVYLGNHLLAIILAPVSTAIYLLIAWRTLLYADERIWLIKRLRLKLI